MKFYIAIVALILILTSCMPEKERITLNYKNLVIMSDLSDRIMPQINGKRNQQYPSKDLDKIGEIIDYFVHECVKPGEKIGDKSSLCFVTFSKHEKICIDLGQIPNGLSKQQYVNSTGKYISKGLNKDLKDFRREIKKLYSTINNKGLDLISQMMEKIENDNLIKDNYVLIDSTSIKFENHIYLFTDGYLEYYDKESNNQFYFGMNEIQKIRDYCKSNSIDVETALEQNKNLCLPIVEYPKSRDIHIHILETHERDKDIELQNYSNPKGLRDNEILEQVWRKWAKESGFASFEWKKF